MNQPSHQTAAATPQPKLKKNYMHRVLGDGAYRALTQTMRVGNFILHPHYEPEVAALPQCVKSGNVCFDIGANYGHYSRLMSPLVGEHGSIHAFEPSSMTCRGLRMVSRALGWRNVRINNLALADTPGELTLTIPIKAHGGLGIALAHLGTAIDRPGITETVSVTTLDSYVQERGLNGCDFIKCDVEGAEFMVLKGAVKTLEQYKPTLLLEIDATYLRRNSHSIADLETLLKALGYEFYVWNSNGLEKFDGLQDRRNNLVIHPSRRTA